MAQRSIPVASKRTGALCLNAPLRDLQLALDSATAVEVKSRRPASFERSRVAIEASVYDRFVAWGSVETRCHLECLDEDERLQTLLRAAATTAGTDTASHFVIKVLDAQGQQSCPMRVALKLVPMHFEQHKAWLIVMP